MNTASGIYDVQSKPGWKALRPFGPCIVKGHMDAALQQVLRNIFEKQRAKKELSSAEDAAWTLAGNIKREFLISPELLGANAALFHECLSSGASQLYISNINAMWDAQRDVATAKHREIVEQHLNNVRLTIGIHSAWGNISVAGDFNPPHNHSGTVSGVGYLRLPDDIEREWLLEDHDPSAGMINFWDGRPKGGDAAYLYRVKPCVGDIYFFPAWLIHNVHPFRSKGERWSFSFNVIVKNSNEDISLTRGEKDMVKAENRRLLKQLYNKEEA
jgi:uncharacterized protein (TIGR02466 family)